MLMEMDKVDVALDKAVESGDPQLSKYQLGDCQFYFRH